MQTLPTQHTIICALLISLCLFFSTTVSSAQITDTTIYTVVEKQPEFSGGFDAMKAYFLTNVQYPIRARKAGVRDRCFVSFVVEIDGSITHVQLLKGIGYGCDEEALRVVSAMPRWEPGSQSGKPIRVKYNLPVLFGVDYPKPRRH